VLLVVEIVPEIDPHGDDTEGKDIALAIESHLRKRLFAEAAIM
jgi:hypothetical protein